MRCPWKTTFNGQLLAFADDTALINGPVGIRLSENTALDNFAANAVLPLTASLPYLDNFPAIAIGLHERLFAAGLRLIYENALAGCTEPSAQRPITRCGWAQAVAASGPAD